MIEAAGIKSQDGVLLRSISGFFFFFPVSDRTDSASTSVIVLILFIFKRSDLAIYRSGLTGPTGMTH